MYVLHSHIHSWHTFYILMAKDAMQGDNCSSGAIWGSGAQGHFDMQLGGAGIQTSDLPITKQPPLPPELQPPQYSSGISSAMPACVIIVWSRHTDVIFLLMNCTKIPLSAFIFSWWWDKLTHYDWKMYFKSNCKHSLSQPPFNRVRP